MNSSCNANRATTCVLRVLSGREDRIYVILHSLTVPVQKIGLICATIDILRSNCILISAVKACYEICILEEIPLLHNRFCCCCCTQHRLCLHHVKHGCSRHISSDYMRTIGCECTSIYDEVTVQLGVIRVDVIANIVC